MPIECALLRGKPAPVLTCKYCGTPDCADKGGWMRGQVQSTWRRLLRLPYCAVICDYCQTITGWEKP